MGGLVLVFLSAVVVLSPCVLFLVCLSLFGRVCLSFVSPPVVGLPSMILAYLVTILVAQAA